VIGVSRGRPVIARIDRGATALQFAERTELAATAGPLTPDHVIRIKPAPMIGTGEWGRAVEKYADEYHRYFARNAGPGQAPLDPAPRWVVWPEVGTIGVGDTAADAAIVIAIARHTARAIESAERLGGWRGLPEKALFEVEYWDLEQAKLRRGGTPPPLQGKIALVTGAASGIGRATAVALHAAGAAVAATDLDPAIETFRQDDLVGLVADATDGAAVARSVATAVQRFGGLDILVSNAGVFSPTERLETMTDAVWEASLTLNLTSHLKLLRAAAPFLQRGFDPSVVIIGSKNVPAPGPGAGAYSVAKAGLTQMARVAALELGRAGVRVNVVHPHAVMDTAAWPPEVLAARAAAYGISIAEYRKRNVLGVEVRAGDVANVVVALAGPTFRVTTGAQIPIDGGNDRVI
jgi:NAD(P)-dependent dehydrogenase (short-subunit alcohol dehydrogenase family)